MSNEIATLKPNSVHWDDNVKVRHLDDLDEDRHSCWMAAAADRARFRRRMQCVAVVLEPVLRKKYQYYLQLKSNMPLKILLSMV
jgi:hypothetical protein